MAASLAADAVGYSRLMGRDEESTLATLEAHQIIDRPRGGFFTKEDSPSRYPSLTTSGCSKVTQGRS